MVGPTAPGPGAAPAPAGPPGNPPAPGGGAPPAAYILEIIGLQIFSKSFCLSSNSSFSASWLASSHLMTSAHFSLTVLRSSSVKQKLNQMLVFIFKKTFMKFYLID